MPSYTKRPKVTRFKLKQTRAGRTVRKTSVARRERDVHKRAVKQMKAYRKPRVGR